VREATAKGDFATALKLALVEAERGNLDAANAAGEMILAGRGAKASAVAALKWFTKAADGGSAPGQLNLARLLAAGAEGVAKDMERARFLVQQAAENGFAPAQVELARLLEAEVDLDGRTPDWREPREWLEKAAAQGYGEALFALVRYHDEGRAGERSPIRATDLCLQAAKAGSVIAMNEMGVRYQKGSGIQQDNVAAVGWLALACQHGLPAAYVNLGNCYETGNGVLQDYDKAGSHYAAAAKQGFAPAEFLLGQLLETGRGTAPNLVNAYVLYSRAASANFAGAAARRDSVKAKLSADQLKEAEKRAARGG
jgi:TPR repeat protein